MPTSEEQVILDYPETMEILIQESVNLLSDLLSKNGDYYITVSMENKIADHLDLCAKLGWKPSEQTS